MSGDVVDAIDHVLGDYALSVDAMRWVPDVHEDEPDEVCGCRYRRVSSDWRRHVELLAHYGHYHIDPDGRVFVNDAGFREIWEALRPAVVAAADTINRAASELVGLVVSSDPLPTDPRARALHLRRTRNVGPDGRTPAGRKRREL